jgi:hypothetical protein
MSTESARISSGTSLIVKSRRFYLIISILMTALVVVGFWPTYFGQFLRGIPDRPWVIHVHGAVFTGWMALLLLQGVLAARGNFTAHRRIGNLGIAYGCVVFIVGLTVSFVAPVLHVKAGEWDIDRAAGFLPIPIGDMILFGSFFGAAVLYRRKSEIHMRLMLFATVALLFAAIGRMTFLSSVPIALLIWFSPVLVGILYDAIKWRKVHRVYWIGSAALIVGLLRLALAQTEPWLRMGRAILRVLL